MPGSALSFGTLREGWSIFYPLPAGGRFPYKYIYSRGGSTHKGLFLVMKPFSGPWDSLGQGMGCGFEDPVLGSLISAALLP